MNSRCPLARERSTENPSVKPFHLLRGGELIRERVVRLLAREMEVDMARPAAQRRTVSDGFFVPRGMPLLRGRGKKPA
jgi:hypothetical protein